MSISHKKINSLIENIIRNSDEFKANSDTTTINKEAFIELCRNIYLLESSTDVTPRSQMIKEIRDEILWHADRLTGN